MIEQAASIPGNQPTRRADLRSFAFFLTYCPLLALGFSALDGLCHLYISGHHLAPTLVVFAEQITAAAVLYAILLIASWVGIWVLLVFLGDARPGIGFLFIAASFITYVLYTNAIDIANRELTDRPLDVAAEEIISGGYGSYLLAVVVAPLCNKIFRGAGKPALMLQATTLAVLLLVETAFSFLVFRMARPETRFLLSLAVAALPAVPTAIFIWWVFPKGWRAHAFVWLAFAIFLLPLPWAFARHEAQRQPTTFAARSHPIKRVIVITIDTLRHDVISTYNPTGGITSGIDRIAHDGTAFVHAFSAAPWTVPAIASTMTGLSPSVHQTSTWSSALPERVETMAEYFNDAGYRTAAVGCNFLLNPRSNVNQGFQEYAWYPAPLVQTKVFTSGLAHWIFAYPSQSWLTTPQVTDRAIRWLHTNATSDFFFWVHYYDPHIPYTPPQQYVKEDENTRGRPSTFYNGYHVRDGLEGRTKPEQAWIRSLYEGEVRYVDANVGRLLDELRTMDLYDDSLIVITSDHGEEFWDHNGFEHGHTLYNELLNVPLFIKRPGDHVGRTVDAYVGTQSLASTLLELCAIPQHTPAVMSPPFTVLLNDPQAPFTETPIVSGATLYFDHMESVIFDRMKYIRSLDSGRESLFDLTRDPGENHSLIDQDSGKTARGRELLNAAKANAAQVRAALNLDPGKEINRDTQDLRTIQSIGYLR